MTRKPNVLSKLRNKIGNVNLRRGFLHLQARVAQLDENMNSEQLMAWIFSDEAELIRPWQFRDELTSLIRAVESSQPKVVMEIGTANGGSLFLHCRVAAPDAIIISMDLPGGPFGGGYPEWKLPLYRSFAKRDQTLHLLRADSHSPESLEVVKQILGTHQIDYLFIDGDHSYDGVKQDFEMFRPLCRPDAMIAFHDVAFHPGSACDVDKYWREVKMHFPSEEFIDDPKQGQFGIGLLRNRV